MSEPADSIHLHETVPLSPQPITGILSSGAKSHMSSISDTPVTDPGSSNKVRCFLL